jgi:hypothetical protein
MVKDDFPVMIREVRKLFPENIKGRIQICTMALTTKQYDELRDAGADGIIMWQETYDRAVYEKHIKRGPKRYGITESWKVDKGGDGFTFRLQSQDRAMEAGLEIAVGTMLGLNPDISYEILATIMHARHLIERGVTEENPVIVGMPTWNKITTPSTDMRPPEYHDPTAIFPYIAALYFLSLPKKKAWIFPNCRVPIETQIESLRAGGIFTSTQVKLGPGGYMPQALKSAQEKGDLDAVRRIAGLMEQHMGVKFSDEEIFEEEQGKRDQFCHRLQHELDKREQFCHWDYTHKEYKARFHAAGLNIVDETKLTPESTLDRLTGLVQIRVSSEMSEKMRGFLLRHSTPPHSPHSETSDGGDGSAKKAAAGGRK